MNRKICAACLPLALLAGAALADSVKPVEKTESQKVTTDSGTTKTKTHTVVGTVKEYAPGKSLAVVVGKRTRKFSLDSTKAEVSVDSSVAIGKKVKVVESRNAQGLKSITVKLAG